MKQWILSVSYDVNGKGSFMVYYFETEQECIDKAEQDWAEFYSIPDPKKNFLARYKNNSQTVKKQVVCDSAGHCTIRNY